MDFRMNIEWNALHCLILSVRIPNRPVIVRSIGSSQTEFFSQPSQGLTNKWKFNTSCMTHIYVSDEWRFIYSLCFIIKAVFFAISQRYCAVLLKLSLPSCHGILHHSRKFASTKHGINFQSVRNLHLSSGMTWSFQRHTTVLCYLVSNWQGEIPLQIPNFSKTFNEWTRL